MTHLSGLIIGEELCHNDSDFDLITTHTALKIWE